MAFGLIIALASLALWQLSGTIDAQWAIAGFVIGGIMVLFGLAGIVRKDVPRIDERTKRLSAYAASWSWFCALTVASFLYLLVRQGIIVLSADQALLAMLVTLLATSVVFNAYYRTRGDVE